MSIINPNTGLATELPERGWDATVLSKSLSSVDEDSKDACIMEKMCGTNKQHFIKVGERGNILNPWTLNTGRESVNKNFGMKYWKWRKVTQATYSLYKKFLKTRNNQFLRDAERMMMING